MDFKKVLGVGLVLSLMGNAQAALNGTTLASLITQAFIVIDQLLDEVILIVPLLIEIGIYFAVLTMILGIFVAIVTMIRKRTGT